MKKLLQLLEIFAQSSQNAYTSMYQVSMHGTHQNNAVRPTA
jgi:hypothetical protein